MTPAARERLQVRSPILVITAIAWALLCVEASGSVALVSHCSADIFSATTLPQLLDSVAAMKSADSFAFGWTTMFVAMMAPLLIGPVRHVRDSSFAARRMRATMLFVGGYAGIWIVGSLILTALVLAAYSIAPTLPFALELAMCIAAIWQCSPLKHQCLNRGHAHPAMNAFGRAADVDALRFGMAHGLWCVGSCWALMLVPLLVTTGHLAAMAAVTLWLLSERLERPMPPRWYWRVPFGGLKLARAQMRRPDVGAIDAPYAVRCRSEK
jgi:predicted metal-binding membrane protein